MLVRSNFFAFLHFYRVGVGGGGEFF